MNKLTKIVKDIFIVLLLVTVRKWIKLLKSKNDFKVWIYFHKICINIAKLIIR